MLDRCRTETSFGLFFGIELDEAGEGFLADGTEVGVLVGAHTTIFLSAPYAMGEIAATLYQRGASFVDEFLPFGRMRGVGGEVGFPGFGIGKIHGVVVTVGIFVAKAAKGVTEFMNHHRKELLATRVTEVVGIVDASAAIVGCIRQDNDMFVGCSCQQVVKALEVQGGQVACGIEGVEMASQGGVEPDVLTGLADVCIMGRRLDGDDIETILQLLEWFVAKQRLGGCTAVGKILIHLSDGVALGNKSHMDASGGVGSSMNRGVMALLVLATDEDVGGIDTMGHRRHGAGMIVAQGDGDLYSLAGVGNEEYVFK